MLLYYVASASRHTGTSAAMGATLCCLCILESLPDDSRVFNESERDCLPSVWIVGLALRQARGVGRVLVTLFDTPTLSFGNPREFVALIAVSCPK